MPGEYQSLAWIAADSGRLTRLFMQSRGDAVGFSSVLPALEKRYRLTGKPGEFEAGEAPARNVWPAVIRCTPYRKAAGGTVEEGTLEFFAGIDGVKKEEAVWDALLEEKKAREAQARQVDSPVSYTHLAAGGLARGFGLRGLLRGSFGRGGGFGLGVLGISHVSIVLV